MKRVNVNKQHGNRETRKNSNMKRVQHGKGATRRKHEKQKK